MVKLTSTEVDLEKLLLIKSSMQQLGQSRTQHKKTSVSIPKGTLVSSIIEAALQCIKNNQLQIIALKLDVKSPISETLKLNSHQFPKTMLTWCY